MLSCNTLKALIVALLSLFTIGLKAQGRDLLVKEIPQFDKLDKIHQTINAHLFQLVSAKKNLKKNEKKPISTTQVEKYILASLDCSLYEELDPDILLSGVSLDQNMVFERIDEEGNYLKLKNENAEFWVHQICVQEYFDSESEPTFRNDASEMEWINLANVSKQSIDQAYKSFQSLLKKNNKKWIDAETNEFYEEVDLLINKINRKKNLADNIYIKIPEKEISAVTTSMKLSDRFSGNVDLLFGRSNFNSLYSTSGLDQLNSGNTNIRINTLYKLNQNSKIQFNLSNRSETRVTPYSNWIGGAGLETKLGKVTWNGKVNYQSHRDRAINIRDFGKLVLQSELRVGSGLSIRYQFLDQRLINQTNNSFLRHSALVRSSIRMSNNSILSGSIDVKLGKSENTFFEYILVKPAIKLEMELGAKKADFTALADLTQFPALETQSNNRYVLQLALKDQGNSESRSRQNLGLIIRTFPKADRLNYLDLSFKTNRTKRQETESSRGILMRIRYFQNASDFSHVDLRYRYETKSLIWFNYDSNLRVNFPNADRSITGYGGFLKLGINLKYLVFGPIFNWQIYYDWKSKLNEQNTSNTYRYGAEARVNYSYKSFLKIRLRASYDFNQTVTGGINTNPFDPLGRTNNAIPSNFQLDGTISYKVIPKAEIFLQANAFDYNANYADDINGDLLERNYSQNFKIGLKYTYK